MQLFLTLKWILWVAFLDAARTIIAHPIPTLNWVNTNEFKDLESHGAWKVLRNQIKSSSELTKLEDRESQVRLTNDRGDELIKDESSGWLYKHGKTLDKAIVSVMVPAITTSAARLKTSREKHRTSYRNYKKPVFHETHSYDGTLGHSNSEMTGLDNLAWKSSLELSSDHHSPGTSYRSSFPFSKFALASSVPTITFSGAFATVMIGMNFAWIAVLIMCFFEYRRYLCKRIKIAQLATAKEQLTPSHDYSSAGFSKMHSELGARSARPAACFARATTETNTSSPLSDEFELDSDGATGLEDYRIV